MKIAGLLLTVALVLHGCVQLMRPPRYGVSADTNQLLKQFRGKTAVLAELVPPVLPYGTLCRLGAYIEGPDGLTIPQFVTKAFNDELKFADLYDESAGVRLSGSMDKIEFSSTAGWWDLALTLRSEKGLSYTAENHHDFPAMLGGPEACSRTAQALGEATQDLIKKAVSHTQFPSLLER